MRLGNLFKNNKIPLLTGKGIVIFPKITVTLQINNEFEIEAIKESLRTDKMFVFVAQKNNVNRYQKKDLFDVGVLCKLIELKGTDKTTYQVVTEGLERVRIKDVFIGNINYAKIEKMILMKTPKEDVEVLFSSLKETLYELYKNYNFNMASISQIESITSTEILCDYLSMSDFFDLKEKQSLLEEINLLSRIEKLTSYVNVYLEKARIKKDLNKKLNSKFTKSQREEFLRQQLEEIKKELGEEDSPVIKNDYSKKITALPISEDYKKSLLVESKRLTNTPENSSEYNVIKTYLDWVLSMPWSKTTRDEFDIQKVREKLNHDHYAMDEVKTRILEFLAITQLNKGMGKAPIICLVGPPGTGKTSLALSVAQSMGRKFARTSLGGVKDEAEIRGHRRTYVAAMPGKIIQSIKRSESSNPVILLDEIDKMGNSNSGDPGSALLEALDPEQNNSFLDHYLDVPFDLSKTMFIATANNIDQIPEALKDRLEIIEISAYTEREKYYIAKYHLIPHIISEHGLTSEMIEFEDLSINRIIHFYIRESGVRELKRKIAAICRYVAINWLEKNKKLVVDELAITKILGAPLFTKERILKEMESGVANGLAWTPYGGDLLFIETSLVKNGSGKIQITGQIGSVMKESAQIALSYILSNSEKLKLDISNIKNHDYHLHIPSGAVKKDGPSAGITLFSSILSALLEKNLPSDLAMSGEITLKGKVLPVGGLKQKIIAANFAGVTKVILSKENESDIIREIPEEIRMKTEFIYVEHLDQIVGYLFSPRTAP